MSLQPPCDWEPQVVGFGDLGPLARAELLLDGVEEALALCLGRFVDPAGEENGARQDVGFRVT